MTDQFDRLTSALADRYAIERELGAGGMATVYLAQDLKHDRKVAIKVLRPELAAVLGAERFLQEIKTTANMQHPHILPLFDSGAADQFLFYVMPYIEGETLREMLNRETQLGIDEAVRITSEVAGALDYAHRQNVIHRDIKPENILLHDGRPMVADFGIALAVSAAAGGRMTETGMSLGTPHYMSPEQATAEKDLTNRSDIYSLASVLYEMLTGNPPHVGSTAQQIVMRILTDEARSVAEIRKSVPPHVAAATAKSLEKLPADRFETAAHFAEALNNPAFAFVSSGAAYAGRHSTRDAWRVISGRVTIGALVLAGLAAGAGWYLGSGVRARTSVSIHRFTVPVAGGHIMPAGESLNLVISPDGRTLAYASDGILRVRQLDSFTDRALTGTAGAESPFFSTDGLWVGFAQDGLLKKISVGGGPVVQVAGAIGAAINPGPSWGQTGAVAYTPLGGRAGIRWLPSEGGAPAQITTVDTTSGETHHLWPQFLDNDRLVLYTVLGPGGVARDAKVMLADRETGRKTIVLEGATFGRYTTSGHLLYADGNGTIFAGRFDLGRGEFTTERVPVLQGVRIAAFGGAASFAVSDEGTAAFVTGSNWQKNLLHWVGRDGRRMGQLGPPIPAGYWNLSPDGKRVALGVTDPVNGDIRLLDVATGRIVRRTTDLIADWGPVWSPDGERLAYAKGVFGDVSIIGVDSAPNPVDITTGSDEIWPFSWSPDGRWFAYAASDSLTQRDAFALNVDSATDRIAIAAGLADEWMPQFSSSGDYVAYVADGEIYVVSFPEIDAARQISENGGIWPRWSPLGNELFFWQGDSLMVTAVSTSGRFSWSSPRLLVEAPEIDRRFPQYGVAPGADRFLMAFENPDAPAREIHVVLNFFEELRAKVGN